MRRSLPLAALLLAASLHPALAGHHSHKTAATADAASTKVTAITKTVLRAEPTEIGKPLGKVRPSEKLLFVDRSPDGKWAQVRKGRVAGWILVEELSGVPDAAAALPPVPTEVPAKPLVATPTPVTPPTPVAVKPAPVAVKPAPVAVKPTPVAPPDTVLRDDPPRTPSETHPAVVPPPSVSTGPAVATGPAGPGATGPLSSIAPRVPLSGLWFSVGGGIALLGSSFASAIDPKTAPAGSLNPELFNYSIDTLPGLAVQGRVGYTYGYRALRVGVDGGYRFAGATSIVVKLPERDSEPRPQVQPDGSIATVSTVLRATRSTVGLTAHDIDLAVSVGGYFALGSKLEMSLRARGGLQIQAFLPDFNPGAVLPKEVLYGPQVGAIVELQSRAIPGFGLRLEGGYIPYAVRTENDGARDAVPTKLSTLDESSTGYYGGGSVALRVTPGFDVELGYRLLSTSTTFADNSTSQRLAFDRDDVVKGRATTETFSSSSRSTSQQTLWIGVAFRR